MLGEAAGQRGCRSAHPVRDWCPLLRHPAGPIYRRVVRAAWVATPSLHDASNLGCLDERILGATYWPAAFSCPTRPSHRTT